MLEEASELRRADFEQFCGGGDVEFGGRDRVERFGQESWEIGVGGIDRESAAV